MPYGALERVLRTERHRQRAAARGGFSTPGPCFTAVGEDTTPLLASNMRGSFVLTRRNAEGLAPMGFSCVPVGQEAPLLNELHRVLWQASTEGGWSNRCSSVAAAVDRLRSFGTEPKSMILSEISVAGLLGPDIDLAIARRSMGIRGYVTVVEGMQVLMSDLPAGSAIITGPPSAVGLYTRVGDHLGLLLQRIDRSLVVVQPDVAG